MIEYKTLIEKLLEERRRKEEERDQLIRALYQKCLEIGKLTIGIQPLQDTLNGKGDGYCEELASQIGTGEVLVLETVDGPFYTSGFFPLIEEVEDEGIKRKLTLTYKRNKDLIKHSELSIMRRDSEWIVSVCGFSIGENSRVTKRYFTDTDQVVKFIPEAIKMIKESVHWKHISKS